MRYLWLAVTSDEYELPIFIADTARELAKKLGLNENSIHSAIAKKNSGRNTGIKIVRVKYKKGDLDEQLN